MRRMRRNRAQPWAVPTLHFFLLCVGNGGFYPAIPALGPRRTTMPLRSGAFPRAHHVGSLIRPDNLIQAREAASKNDRANADLQRIQEAAIRDVVRLQEDLGLKVVTDGEYNRGSWQRD